MGNCVNAPSTVESDGQSNNKPKEITQDVIDGAKFNLLNQWSDEKGSSTVKKNEMVLKFIPIKPSYWVVSGWLPSPEANREWFNEFNKVLNFEPASWHEIIQKFYDFIMHDSAIIQPVTQMINAAKKKFGPKTPIQSIVQMCAALNSIITMTPQYSSNKENPLIGVPMAALFADVAENPAGMAVFLSDSFNAQLTLILKAWMAHLDSPESFTKAQVKDGWLSPEAKKEYNFDNYQTELKESPYWTSWNSFFTRNYKPEIINARFSKHSDDGNIHGNIIQLPNDGGEFRYRTNVKLFDEFWLKDMPYSLANVFGAQGSGYGEAFSNGSVFQSYLDPFNYHCYNAPVDGVVIASYVLKGAYFAQLVWEYDIPDPGAGTLSLPWLSQVNARGIFIINTAGHANIGLVGIVAIGMGEVSSVNFFPQVGATIKKGDQFGCFKFGGSSIAVITQDLSKYNKILTYDAKFPPTAPDSGGPPFYAGDILATISPKLLNI